MLTTMALNVSHLGLQTSVGRSPLTTVRVTGSRRASSDAPEVRLAVLGALGVGKSALVVKYITKRFIMEYDPLLEDVYSKAETIDGRDVNVKLMDTSDSEEKSSDRYLKWANGFIVVFSITCRSSFDEASLYLELIGRHQQDSTSSSSSPSSPGAKDYPVALVGNKADLERYRTVSKSTAEELASHFDCTYLETSAAEDLRSVVLVFHEITRDVIRSRDLQLSMQSLYISEDRTPLLGNSGVVGGGHGPALLSGIGGGHSPMGGTKRQQGHHSSKAAKDMQKDIKDAEKKDESKLVHRRPTTSFKLFNKSFKIFN